MTQYHDKQYLALVKDVLENGVSKGDRTGTGTLSVFSRQMRFDLRNMSIPMLTTKKMHVRSIIHEIIWYLTGDTNIQYLNDNNVTIWDEWADERGNLGPVYGYQWRRWPTYKHVGAHAEGYEWCSSYYEKSEIDQIANLINTLRTNPNDRRMIVSAWNVADLDRMALPPCHYAFQFWANPETKELSCMLNQRSCDVGLGVPFNIVQYSILTHMIAYVTGFTAREFIWNGGDVHIYKNHIEALEEQLTRDPMPSPTLKINSPVKEIDDFKFEDFEIVGYTSHPTIKMTVSV